MLQYFFILALDITIDYWVIDSWVSCHATSHMKFFHDYVIDDFGHVLMGDDEPCKIVGMGKVLINLCWSISLQPMFNTSLYKKYTKISTRKGNPSQQHLRCKCSLTRDIFNG